MAARKNLSPFRVPSMNFSGEEDAHDAKTREKLGKELKSYIIGLNTNLYRQPPNKAESQLIYKLFMKQKFDKRNELVKIQDTTIYHNTIMHYQNK